ncbi:hypothetical protein SODALDRAFT_330439 [Sodiomyces alkalinus F11]|uniref:SigF-like NTF2-like domain-containing protein n=1 Tax=Sodiomyces alkalinus (strain CBS 110278 / VKM F-3762 / F11) TaxID=1314773 RepID=A0A3N2Q1Y5_SODAK|nr:hypothetical protein SODALDRAFT_330439 [Sodiomyces alkalinus F11]ROT40698.1 hypothetical protein SODALDRAFT_330439 [Sodiomyces alkalinus F11]
MSDTEMAKEIVPIIKSLAQGTPSDQERVINSYFLPEASFIHNLCRVPSFNPRHVPFTDLTIGSRWFVLMIYRWYRILSPHIDLQVNSVVHDEKSDLLFLHIRQIFTFFFFPLYHADVSLITLLRLEQRPLSPQGGAAPPPEPATITTDNGSHDSYAAVAAVAGAEANGSTDLHDASLSTHYFIASQEDFYQPTDLLKFIAPFYGAPLYAVWQLFATLLSAVGALIFAPLWWTGKPGFRAKLGKKEA